MMHLAPKWTEWLFNAPVPGEDRYVDFLVDTAVSNLVYYLCEAVRLSVGNSGYNLNGSFCGFGRLLSARGTDFGIPLPLGSLPD